MDDRSHFELRGIPTVALIKRGRVVWCGRAAHVTDDLLDGLLNGRIAETPTSRAAR